jgi:hypothetical protein
MATVGTFFLSGCLLHAQLASGIQHFRAICALAFSSSL